MKFEMPLYRGKERSTVLVSNRLRSYELEDVQCLFTSSQGCRQRTALTLCASDTEETLCFARGVTNPTIQCPRLSVILQGSSLLAAIQLKIAQLNQHSRLRLRAPKRLQNLQAFQEKALRLLVVAQTQVQASNMGQCDRLAPLVLCLSA